MTAPDFRAFIDLLDAGGELDRVLEPTDWNLGIGARARAEARDRNRALLFESVDDYPGWRVLVNAVGSPARVGIALGLPSGCNSIRDVHRAVRHRLANPIEPILDAGSVSGETRMGDDVDLTALPVPWWSPEDGGRYLGTWHLNITRDPLSGTRNVGVYRMQLVDRRTLLVSASGSSHLMGHVSRAEERGESLSMAVAVGVMEPLVMAAGAAVSPEIDEYFLAGSLAGRPIRLRAANSLDLEVPAEAEIVIEGHLVSGERMAEGPFLDYGGVARGNPSALVFRASVLTVRDRPVFRGAAIGYAGAEDHLVYALLASAGRLDFRGSRARHYAESVALRAGWFRAFGTFGRLERPWGLLDRALSVLGAIRRRVRGLSRR